MSHRTELTRDFKAALYGGASLEELQRLTNTGIRRIHPGKQAAVADELQAIHSAWALQVEINRRKDAPEAAIITGEVTPCQT